MTLIAAKWKEFASAAGQWKKTKTGLTSPTEAKDGFADDSALETPIKDTSRFTIRAIHFGQKSLGK